LPETSTLNPLHWLLGPFQGRTVTPGRVPREPDFWRLWVVGLVIFVVRWIETVAVAVVVYQRTGSALIVAMVTMLRTVPMGLFGAFLGVAADRLERRTGLILIVLASLATSVTLAVLAHLDRLAVWHLAAASFINGIGWAADNPVRRMMIGDVVGTRRLGTAMSIDVGANNASRMVGPTMGGILLATVGIAGAFTLSAVLYLVALAAAVGVHYRNKPVHAAGGTFVRIAEGLRLARRNRHLRGTLIITIIFNLFGWPFTSMIPVIGQDHLQLGPKGIGLLASMEGVGAFCGAVVIALFAGSAHRARLYIGGVILYLVCLTLFALTPNALLAGSALLVTGLGGSAFSIMQATLIYQSAPPDMRGRMLGTLATCIGLGPLGFIHIGLLAEAFGAQNATIMAGIEGLIVLLLTRPLWLPVIRPGGGVMPPD
jgi:MFS family permease